MATQIRTKTESSSGGGASTVKTTTYETTRSFNEEPVYRPKLTQRNLVIQRGGTMPMSSMSMQRSQSYGMNISPGAYQAVSALGVANVKTSRDREKKDMQDLNERFASYIERVRFLEAQNRKLADELDKLKSKWGKETTAIKAMYQAELDEARRLLDDAEKEKARLQIRCSTIEQELEELREK
jgi:intermediate filament protein if